MIDRGHSLEHNPIPLSGTLAANVTIVIRTKDPTRDKKSAEQKAGCKNGESRPPLQMLTYVRLLLSQKK